MANWKLPLLTAEVTVIVAVPPFKQSVVTAETSITKSSGGEAMIIFCLTTEQPLASITST